MSLLITSFGLSTSTVTSLYHLQFDDDRLNDVMKQGAQKYILQSWLTD
jgi:hypothetical protein